MSPSSRMRSAPAFTFKVSIPTPGRYVIWSQVNLGGTETFAPFWFDVAKPLEFQVFHCHALVDQLVQGIDADLQVGVHE
jgi:hypothetical protein